jgi:RNA polymerase sigma-70 factor (ECF subfamily)
MQEVFIKAWHSADSYSSKKGRFFTWLINISRNAAIDKIRSKSFKNAGKNLNSDYFVDIIQDHDSLEDKTDAIGIKKFVGKLKKKCIEVIELLYFKGYTQKEASETLEMPIGTIKTRNRNCINELRLMLEV